MSNSDKNKLSFQTINYADTISQFMEKVNNNFEKIIESNGGPAGVKGDDGDQGVPTKPKVPIHVWVQNEHYNSEYSEGGTFRLDLNGYENELTDVKYQEGHLILLQNAHVYILEVNNDFTLYPRFLLSFQSYNSGDVVDGRPTYVHFAYSENPDGEGLRTDQELKEDNINTIDMPYMGVCSNHDKNSPKDKKAYSWMRIQGADGKDGEDGADGKDGVDGEDGKDGKDGVDGENGDNFTGHAYIIDLEGDMSTISVDGDGYRQYEGDYCECVVHAYYGNDCVDITPEKISVILPDGYSYDENNKIINKDGNVGEIIKEQSFIENQQVYVVKIQFIPDETFKFPEKTIIFKIHVEAQITDNKKEYLFYRDTIWMVKGIVSTFELEIKPQYNEIKITDENKYLPEFLTVNVYKTEGSIRETFDFNNNKDFKLLYKNYDNDTWLDYYDPEHPEISTNGVPTQGVICLEFKVVKYYRTPNEELWDYEDVWTIADGKSVHYYHGDLGSTESMMVLVTDVKYNFVSESGSFECVKLRNEPEEVNGSGAGYSIIFNPKFFDGSEELTVKDVSIGPNSGDEHYLNGYGPFARKLELIDDSEGNKKYKFTVTRVPAGIDMIPMNFIITAEDNDKKEYFDTVGFNTYISSLSSIYTLIPTVSAFNTSTGKTLKNDSLSNSDSDLDCDSIGCRVYKNDNEIALQNLGLYSLNLKYIVYGENGNTRENTYSEELVYGEDDDIVKDYFTASDVSIVFILSYGNREIVRSTVPLIKDGMDGLDGEFWQYIFCRSNSYPFSRAAEIDGISDPSTWIDNDPYNSDNELLGDGGVSDSKWTDNPQGIGPNFKYEYQAYRKWERQPGENKNKWSPYGYPTLYSNYSVGGDSNSVNYKAILSNPVAIIPVGNNDFTDDGSDVYKTQSDFTYVYFYDNTSDISTNENIEVEIDKNDVRHNFFEIERDENYNNIWKVSFNPSYIENDEIKYFEFDADSPFNLPITVTYTIGGDANSDGTTDFFETKIFWTLKPLFNKYDIIEDVELFVDKTVVDTTLDCSENNFWKFPFRVGYYLTSNGTKKFIEKKGDDNKGYSIYFAKNLNCLETYLKEGKKDKDYDAIDAYKENEKGEVVWDWYNFVYNAYQSSNAIDLFSNSIFCIVALVDNNNNIIDYTTIHSIKSELSVIFNDNNNINSGQTYYYFPSNNSLKRINPLYASDIRTILIDFNLYLYVGSKDISNNKYTSFGVYLKHNNSNGADDVIEIDPVVNENGKIENNHFQLKVSDVNLVNSSKMTLHCKGLYKTNYIKKLINIELTQTPYELEINKGVLTRSASTDETLDVKVKHWDNNENDWKYLTNSDTFTDSLGYACSIYLNDDYSKKYSLEKRGFDFEKELLNPRIFYYNLSGLDLTNATYITLELTQTSNGLSSTLSKELLYIIDSDGASATHLELTQDHILLPADKNKDENGNETINYYAVHSSYVEPIQTQMILYSGDQIITSGIDYSFAINEELDTDDTISVDKTGTITIPKDSIKGDTNIKCTATYNGVSYHKVLFVDLEATPYEMEINKNILQRDVNSGLIILDEDDPITVHVKYWKEGNWFYTHKGEVCFESPYDSNLNKTTFEIKNEKTKDSPLRDGYERTLILSDDIKKSKSPEFRIYYKNSYDIEVSSETLGVINSGKNGEDGTSSKCIASEIIGYALDPCPEIPNTEDDEKRLVGEGKVWKPKIQDLYGDKNANEMVGTQIFILLKEKWEKENSNEDPFYIYRTTVTLAGTQGIDGKSRVLFYLGSYYKGEDNTETPTLTDDRGVVGYLTDLRCDYYIDVNGDAWMRKGSEKSVMGNKDGNPDSPYWEKADKVGFLQAGAIHADMINAGSITSSNAFVDAIKSIEIIGDTIQGKTIKSSTPIPNITENGNLVATWQINNNGSGWLANRNIKWDEYGNLNLGGNTNTDDDNITIHNSILNKYKKFPIVHDGSTIFPLKVNFKNFKFGTINKIVITDPESNIETINKLKENTPVIVHLTSSISNMEVGDAIDLDFINNSDFTLSFDTLSSITTTDKKTHTIYISTPSRKDNFSLSPIYNFGKHKRTGVETNDELLNIYILPNTMISLSILKEKETENSYAYNVFIKNLSDFIYTNNYNSGSYKNDEGDTVNYEELTINKCLMSKIPDFNNLPTSYTKVFNHAYNTLKIYNLNINVINVSGYDYGKGKDDAVVYVAKEIHYNTTSGSNYIHSTGYDINSQDYLDVFENYYTQINRYDNKNFHFYLNCFDQIYSNQEHPLKDLFNKLFKIKPINIGTLEILIVIPMFNLTFRTIIGHIIPSNLSNSIYHTDFTIKNLFKTYKYKSSTDPDITEHEDILKILQSLLLQSPNSSLDIQILLYYYKDGTVPGVDNKPQSSPQRPQ